MDSYTIARIDKTEYSSYQKNPYYPVIIENESLWLIDKQSSRDEVYLKIWLSVKLEVKSLLKDEDSNEKYLRILATTSFGVEEEIIPTAWLNKKDIINLQGKWFFNEAYSAELIKYLIRSSEKVPCITRYNSVGWFGYGDCYLFRTNKVICEDNAIVDGFQYSGSMKLDNLISEKNFEDYLSGLNDLLITEGSMFAVVAGLSSVLLSYLKLYISMENILIHIYGDSSRGKSTFLKLAASMWGEPNSPPLVNEWNSTTNAIYSTLANNMGITVGFDEASCSNADFSTLIYNISHGRDKAKCNKDSTLRAEREWSTTVISNAEESLLDKTKKNNGIRARCLEFENLAITTDSDHAEFINSFIMQNFGIMGEIFVEYLYSKKNKIVLNDYKICKRFFSKKLEHDKCSITDRVIKSYAVLLQTAIYSKRIGLQIDLHSIIKVLVDQHTYLCDETKTSEYLYNAICDYILTHKHLFPEESHMYEGSPCEGVISKTSVLISHKTLEKIIFANKFTDMKLAVKWLCKDGFLKKQAGKYYRMKTINKVPVKCYEIFNCISQPSILSPTFTGTRVEGKKRKENE